MRHPQFNHSGFGFNSTMGLIDPTTHPGTLAPCRLTEKSKSWADASRRKTPRIISGVGTASNSRLSCSIPIPVRAASFTRPGRGRLTRGGGGSKKIRGSGDLAGTMQWPERRRLGGSVREGDSLRSYSFTIQ